MPSNSPFNNRTNMLGKEDPPPFEIINPKGGTLFLLVCDHAGRHIPRVLSNLGLSANAFDLHIAYDIGAGAVARNLSNFLGAPLVLANYSRLLIDLNRPPEHPGSIVPVSDDILIPGNEGLNEDSRSYRIREIFEPYHNAINQSLKVFLDKGKKPTLISVHSFSPDFGGEPRPWDIGVLWNNDLRVAQPLIELLNSEGLNVGNNRPYSGHDLGYTLDRHSEEADLPNCAVEINQNQLRDEAGIARWSAILGQALITVLNGLNQNPLNSSKSIT